MSTLFRVTVVITILAGLAGAAVAQEGVPLDLQIIRVRGLNDTGSAVVVGRLTGSEPLVVDLRVNDQLHSSTENFKNGYFVLALEQSSLSRSDTNILTVELMLSDGAILTGTFNATPEYHTTRAASDLTFMFSGEGMGIIVVPAILDAESISFRWTIPASGYVSLVPSDPNSDLVTIITDFTTVYQRGMEPSFGATVTWQPKGPTIPVSLVKEAYLIDSTSQIRGAEPGQDWWFVPGQGQVTVDVQPVISVVEGNVAGIPLIGAITAALPAIYEVTITTGDRDGAGTDANVFLTFVGTKARSSEIALDLPDIDDRERSTTNTYRLHVSRSIGHLHSLRVRHDNSGDGPGWYIDAIQVYDQGTGATSVFPADRWLADDEGDRAIDHIFASTTLRVTVITGRVSGAGTDAAVQVTLHSAGLSAGPYTLDTPDHNDFEYGQRDSYLVYPAIRLDDLTSLDISHDNSGDGPGWYLERIEVEELATGRRWIFPCQRWLATDEDDGQISRTLTVST